MEENATTQITRKDTKKVLIRVLQIMEMTDEKTPMNSKAINDLLEQQGMPRMDRKTISDNMTTLMECGYSIRQMEDKRKGWYLADHKFADWELKLMMDAVQQARFISANEALKIKEKMLEITSERGRSRFTHLMEFRPGNLPVDRETGAYLEDLLEAMYTGKKIEFQYTEIDNHLNKVLRREGKKYLLNLYAICWSNDTYYLIGAHDHHDGPTQYRLDRVENLRITKENVTPAEEKLGPNPELSIQDFVDKSVNHFSGDEVRLTVEYEPRQETNAILYDFAGDDVKVEDLPNGNCLATFKKMDSVTLVGWFMQYGNLFRVVGPENVRDEIRAKLEQAAERYRNAGQE